MMLFGTKTANKNLEFLKSFTWVTYLSLTDTAFRGFSSTILYKNFTEA